MARPLQIPVAGGWYHVMSRGSGGEAQRVKLVTHLLTGLQERP